MPGITKRFVKMKRLCLTCHLLACMVLFRLPSPPWKSSVQAPAASTPSYSMSAITIEPNQTVVSPDGKVSVRIRRIGGLAASQPALILIQTPHLKLEEKIAFGLNTEILWSPDSHAFALTGSSEGANGSYLTQVIRINERGMNVLQLTPLIREVFGHPVKCGWREPPNVAALSWSVPSKELIVVAEIMHHSNCDSFGTFVAYAVNLNGPRVAKTYDQLEAKRLFSEELGPELRQADDGCIRNPPACYVHENHPELGHTP